jgi:hypothetical protein
MTAAATPGFVEWSGDEPRPTRKARLGCGRCDSAATGGDPPLALRHWRPKMRAAVAKTQTPARLPQNPPPLN